MGKEFKNVSKNIHTVGELTEFLKQFNLECEIDTPKTWGITAYSKGKDRLRIVDLDW